VLDPLLELPAVGSRLARQHALQLAPGRLELALRARVVDLLDVHGIVHEREGSVGLDLEEPGARGELEHLAVAQVHARRA
jgi:hypothetical protein